MTQFVTHSRVTLSLTAQGIPDADARRFAEQFAGQAPL